jgi:hypothetical protein
MPRPQAPRGAQSDLPAGPDPHRRDGPSEDVALLAATALGFAFAPTGNDQRNTRRLATLADCCPESLSRAQDAVLALDIGSVQVRRRAATLLQSAAGRVAGPGGAEPSLGEGDDGAPLVAATGIGAQ